MALDWEDWEPWYSRIVSDLGYDPEEDEKAADILASLLELCDTVPSEKLERLFQGREVIVFGPASVPRRPSKSDVKVAVGSAINQLMEKKIQPDILVTDLDWDVEAQVEANGKGAIAVIHAHGDNIDEMRKWVPKFKGPVLGTTQAKAKNNVYNFGGFTDGDRAVFLASCFGPRSIIISGFDFDNPVEKPGGEWTVKKKKLTYARQLIEFAIGHFDIDIEYED